MQLSDKAKAQLNSLLKQIALPTTNFSLVKSQQSEYKDIHDFLIEHKLATQISLYVYSLTTGNGKELHSHGDVDKYLEWEDQERVKEESKHTSHYGDKITINANDIIGSAIGRHASLRKSNPIKEATITETANISIPEPTVNSRGWLKKLMWWIFGCIVSFWVGVAVYFYTKGK